jgi:hypothetical protein
LELVSRSRPPVPIKPNNIGGFATNLHKGPLHTEPKSTSHVSTPQAAECLKILRILREGRLSSGIPVSSFAGQIVLKRNLLQDNGPTWS